MIETVVVVMTIFLTIQNVAFMWKTLHEIVEIWPGLSSSKKLLVWILWIILVFCSLLPACMVSIWLILRLSSKT